MNTQERAPPALNECPDFLDTVENANAMRRAHENMSTRYMLQQYIDATVVVLRVHVRFSALLYTHHDTPKNYNYLSEKKKKAHFLRKRQWLW